MHRDRPLPDELADTADLLRSERATINPDTDERLRRRLDRAAARPARAGRSSVAIALCLMFGALFSVGGTSLAVSGLSSSGVTAKSAQYAPPTQTTPANQQTTQSSQQTPAGGTPSSTTPGTTTPGSGTEVLGQEDSQQDIADEEGVAGEEGGGDGGSRNGAGVAGETGSDAGSPEQPARQVAASNAEGLPFTGYASVPLLLLGIALLASGAVLRRRTRLDA